MIARLLLNNWRMKALAVILSVAMLSAVAFSQNPFVTRTLRVPIKYQRLPEGLVLVSYPKDLEVQVSGLQSQLQTVDANSVSVTADLSGLTHERSGVLVKDVEVRIKSLILSDVRVEQTKRLVQVGVDAYRTEFLDVEVRQPQVQANFALIKAEAVDKAGQPVKVKVSGPETILNGLHAYAQVDGVIQDTQQFPSVAVHLVTGSNEEITKPPDTMPLMQWDSTVPVLVTTVSGTLVRQGSLREIPSGNLPRCYSREVLFSDPFVTLSGPASAVREIGDVIGLPPIDISNATSDRVQTFDLNSLSQLKSRGVVATPNRVTVTVSIKGDPVCLAPIPSPSPTPNPSPSPTPRPSP